VIEISQAGETVLPATLVGLCHPPTAAPTAPDVISQAKGETVALFAVNCQS